MTAPAQTAFRAPPPVRAISFAEVAGKGKVRKRQDGKGWYLDLRPHGTVFVVPGLGRLKSRRVAEQVLSHIQGGLWRGEPMEFVLATYRPAGKKPRLFGEELERWLRVQRGRCRSGDISPTYLREIERYAKPDGYFSWWVDRSIFEIQYGMLEEWLVWLGDRGLAPRTRKHALDTMRTFLRWERRSRKIESLPEFPAVRVPEHAPTLLSLGQQDAILQAIPLERRGAFLALARLGLRPGEVRALDVDDYHDGELRVTKAAKGARVTAPIRGTKTGAATVLPVWDDETREWLDARLAEVTPQNRLSGQVALFQNPRARHPAKRWTTDSLEDEWARACKQVGVRCSLYEGTKHSFATAMLEGGVNLKVVQTALRHADIRSTERYAKLRPRAMVTEMKAAGKRLRKSAKRKRNS